MRCGNLLNIEKRTPGLLSIVINGKLSGYIEANSAFFWSYVFHSKKIIYRQIRHFTFIQSPKMK